MHKQVTWNLKDLKYGQHITDESVKTEKARNL